MKGEAVKESLQLTTGVLSDWSVLRKSTYTVAEDLKVRWAYFPFRKSSHALGSPHSPNIVVKQLCIPLGLYLRMSLRQLHLLTTAALFLHRLFKCCAFLGPVLQVQRLRL